MVGGRAGRAGLVRGAGLAALALLAAGVLAAWVGWPSPSKPQPNNPTPNNPTPQNPPTAGPPTLGVGELLAGHAGPAGEWRLAWWQEDPRVLVIDFPSLREQGLAMNRVAAFLQKAGAPRDRLLDDAELANFIAQRGETNDTFFHGHDFSQADLTRFFQQALRQQLRLGMQELKLRNALTASGLLSDEPGAPRAVVTFTATQPDDPSTPQTEAVDALRREAILRHELSHGRFYTQPAYRAHCHVLWNEMLTERQRQRLRQHLAELGYDTSDETLVVNEAQAYLLHTPDNRAFSAAQAGMGEQELQAVRAQFWQSLPPEVRGKDGRQPLKAR